MRVLENIEPKAVFAYFEELCAIPHGSGNTRAISDHLVQFAAAHGLACRQDAANNVVITKPGTPGAEHAAPVILQGHMDMVCEKAPGCRKDMDAEGLDLAVEDGHVLARGTTLGGDDGIAVAMMLALLADGTLPHPPLEAVFTADEEIGMPGAAALDASPLRGRRMINLDSEEEGIFTVSCAGACVAECRLPLARESAAGEAVTLCIGGLAGGHSGQEIDKGRANACRLMGSVLYRLLAAPQVRLLAVDGGRKHNAIPAACTAELLTDDAAALQAAAAQWTEAFRQEYAAADPGITVTAEPHGRRTAPALTRASARKAVCMLLDLPDGVQAMSRDIPGLVQTSLNLGILATQAETLSATFLVRSALDAEKHLLCDRLSCLMDVLGGSVGFRNDYSSWEYRRDSALRTRMAAVYRAQYGTEPKIAAIHAGLECGLFCGKLPGLDAVSIGPNLTDIHTCRERMDIASVQRVWRFLCEVLRCLC